MKNAIDIKTHTLRAPGIHYLICATPRSGSTLLCEALRNTGLAGNPDEYFGPMHVERWNEQWNTQTAHQYLERVRKVGSGQNGVWGAKVMRLYWEVFVGQLRDSVDTPLTDEALLSEVFPSLKCILITRRDKVRQAVSWMKFLQGSAWFWEKEIPQRIEGLVYRPDIISSSMEQTMAHESEWRQFFRDGGFAWTEVVYEDFVDAYEETAVQMLDFLGVPRPKTVSFGSRRLRRQADDLSDRWVARYLSETSTTG